MLLQQICSGKANGSIQSYQSAVYDNVRYIFYGTSDCVVIHNGDFEYIQTIPLEPAAGDGTHSGRKRVEAVRMSRSGMIAAALGQLVYVFEPIPPSKSTARLPHVQWKQIAALEHADVINCLDWTAQDNLLTGGNHLTIWKHEFEATSGHAFTIGWQKRVSTPAILVKYDPTSEFFASVGANDRFVKIWYKNEQADGYSFQYLPHPQRVRNLTWRKASKYDREINAGGTVFLTMCQDGVCRLWSPSPTSASPNFQLCAVIDPNQSLVTSQAASIDGNKDDPQEFSPIHCIDREELLKAAKIAEATHKHEKAVLQQSDIRLKRLLDMIGETSDLAFQVQQDGSLVIWGIRDLGGDRKRIPRVFVVLRVDSALLPSDAAYFAGTVNVWHDHLGVKAHSSILPVELTFLAQSPHGRLNCYTINLIDFLDSTGFASRMYLQYSWSGHHDCIQHISQRCVTGPFMTIAKDGEAALWQYENPRYGTRVHQGLRELTAVYHSKPILLAAALPGGKCMAIYDGDMICLYTYHAEDSHSYLLQKCNGYDKQASIAVLQAYQYQTAQGETETLLVALSPQSTCAFIWKIILGENGAIEHVGDAKKCQFGSSAIDIVEPTLQWSKELCGLYDRQELDICVTFSHSQQILSFWDASYENGSWVMEDYISLKVDIEDVQYIRVGCTGIIALASEKILQIYGTIEEGEPPTLEFSYTFTEPILDLAWNFSSDAQHILAIAFPKRIEIWGRRRIEQIGVEDSWVQYLSFDGPPGLRGSTELHLAWNDHSSLVVSCYNQMYVYSKWMSAFDDVKVLRYTEETNCPTLFELAFAVNGPLHHYHPLLLIHYVLWSKLKLVNHILLVLHNHLKFVVERDETVDHIPPISYAKLLELEDAPEDSKDSQYDALFTSDSLQEGVAVDDGSTDRLPQEVADFLLEELKHKSLPGISHVEQLNLMAQIDTLSKVDKNRGSYDENGLRYLMCAQRFLYLNRVLPMAFRAETLEYRDMVWALFSESQDLLLDYSLQSSGGSLKWPEARALGIFFWLDRREVVCQQFEAIARNIFTKQEVKDPVAVSLFYIALRKKKLLLGLWRTAHGNKEQAATLKLLANDFEQPRWQTAALKNAFALLSKQRFEYAAAFFLLADRLRDAANVCIKHLKDWQLAIAICRVYEGDDSAVLKDILRDHVIPMAISLNDRWLLCAANWILGERDLSLQAIALPWEAVVRLMGHQELASQRKGRERHDPALFILYQELKKKTDRTRKRRIGISSEMEYQFALQTIFAYERLGCPLLSLYVLETARIDPPVEPVRRQSLIAENRSLTSGNEECERSLERGLFDSETFTPFEIIGTKGSATDILDLTRSDTNGSKPSTETIHDLFADNTDQPPKLIDDLFADIPMSNIAQDDNLFADMQPTFSALDIDEENLSPRTEQAVMARQGVAEPQKSSDQIAVDNGKLSRFKVVLVKELIQYALHAVAAVSEDSAAFILDSTAYQSYIDKGYEGFMKLCQTANLPESVLTDAMISKCIETDSFALCVRLLNEDGDTDFEATTFIKALVENCTALLRLVFNAYSAADSIAFHLSQWSRHVLASFAHWYVLVDAHPIVVNSHLQARQIAISAYFAIILTSVREQNYSRAWACLSQCQAFCKSLVGSPNNTQNIINAIMEGKFELPQDDHFEDDNLSIAPSTVSGTSQPFSTRQSTASKLLELGTTNLLVGILESFLQDSDNNLDDEFTAYMLTALLVPMLKAAHIRKIDVESLANGQISKTWLFKQLTEPGERQYWRAMMTMKSAEELVTFSSPTDSQSSAHASVSDSKDLYELVYRSKNTMQSFCINPVDENIAAVCTKLEIQEIDISKALTCVPGGSGPVSTPKLVHKPFSEDLLTIDADAMSEAESDDDVARSDAEADPRAVAHTKKHLRVHALENEATAKEGLHVSLSFENLQGAVKKSYQSVFATDDQANQSDAESEKHVITRRRVGAYVIANHPKFPYFITGGMTAAGVPCLTLWQFGQSQQLMVYSGLSGRVTRIRFDRYGQKFGAGDQKGNFALWRFTSTSHNLKPYYTLHCHSKSLRDFAFIDSSSLVVTVGTSVSQNKTPNLCLWDTLMPPNNALIWAPNVHPNGAYVAVYSPKTKLLFSGGGRGEICVINVHAQTILHTIQAHNSRIRSLWLDETNNAFISGSVDGELKVWDLYTFTEKFSTDIQMRNRFMAPGLERIPKPHLLFRSKWTHSLRLLIVMLHIARRTKRLDHCVLKRYFTNSNGYEGLVLGVYGGKGKGAKIADLSAEANVSDETRHTILNQLAASGARGKLGEVRTLYNIGGVKQVAVVGLGQCEDFTSLTEDKRVGKAIEAARIAAAVGVKVLRDQGIKTIGIDTSLSAHGSAEGATLALFSFDKLKATATRKPEIDIGAFTTTKKGVSSEYTWDTGLTYGSSQNLARTLMETPANLMTPKIFADEVAYVLAGLDNVEVMVRDRDWVAQKGMNGLLSVSNGSDEPLRFLEIHYKGGKEGSKPLGLVGKGITFDSGGISIKPSNGMAAMKGDMGGAAVVAGAMYGICKLQLPLNVVAVTPLTENMPSGKATKPGDVIKAMNGTSIEVADTDAEGRLILADALYYLSSNFKPHSILDFATLTGAMDVALGSVYAGVFSSDDDLWNQLQTATDLTSDLFWRMPLHIDYLKQMRSSSVADLCNLGSSRRSAGSCTAAAFLQEFVAGLETPKETENGEDEEVKSQDKKIRWAHVDIAGVMENTGNHAYNVKGMSGRPTRSILEFARLFGAQ